MQKKYRKREAHERKLPRYRKRNAPARYSSSKLISRPWSEGSLELDSNLLLDYDDTVSEFEGQPAPLFWPALNKKGLAYMKQYTPDFRVFRTDGSVEYWEVKPEKFVNNEVMNLIANGNAAAMTLGATLRLVTERDIHRGHLIENLRELSWHKDCVFSMDIWKPFAQSLPNTITVADLRARLVAENLIESWAFASIWRRLCTFDLEAIELCDDTVVEVLK